jgi:excisionase family DNA binding protein
MENVVFTQLSITEFRKVFRQELETYFKNNPQADQQEEAPDKLLTVQEAADFLKLTVPTIYSKVSRGELPVMKRSKRLYFSRKELVDYLKEGRRKSNAEIEAQAESYLLTNMKGLTSGK